jgi:colicin import membrane protein
MMTMTKSLKLAVLALSLAVSGCDNAQKKAEEAKALAEKQASEAKAAAEKQVAEAKAAADKEAAALLEKARVALTGQKADLTKSLTEGVEMMDRKLDFLKQRAAKLPAAQKAKADAALAAFDAAKAALLGSKTQAENAADPAAFADASTKAATALADAQKALGDAEATIIPPKK